MTRWRAQRSVAWRGVAWRGVALRGVAWRGVAWRRWRMHADSGRIDHSLTGRYNQTHYDHDNPPPKIVQARVP